MGPPRRSTRSSTAPKQESAIAKPQPQQQQRARPLSMSPLGRPSVMPPPCAAGDDHGAIQARPSVMPQPAGGAMGAIGRPSLLADVSPIMARPSMAAAGGAMVGLDDSFDLRPSMAPGGLDDSFDLAPEELNVEAAGAALEAEFGAEAAAPAAAGAGMGEVSLGPVGDISLTGGADGSAGPLGESFALGDGSFAANTSLGASLCASLNVSLGPSETSATEAPGTLAALAAAKSPEPAMSKKQLAALKRGAAKKAAQLKEQTLAKQNEYFAEVDQWELEELEEDDAVVA